MRKRQRKKNLKKFKTTDVEIRVLESISIDGVKFYVVGDEDDITTEHVLPRIHHGHRPKHPDGKVRGEPIMYKVMEELTRLKECIKRARL